MFSKGSRYRNLPESSVLTAQGERLRGKELRVMTQAPGRFQHVVHDSDRLDLLGFRYYGDPARWWQISDANPEFAYPVDMLDPSPIVEERLVLRPDQFYVRFEALRIALSNIGEVRAGESIAFNGDAIPQEPDFIESTVLVKYAPGPGVRQQILGEITQRFHFLRAFSWLKDGQTTEAFTFDDQLVKSQWREMTSTLASEPGVLELHSTITEATIEVVYHDGMLVRQQIVDAVNDCGFSIQGDRSAVLRRAGSKVIIPPNAIS